ncbi:MAG: YfbK domain-containing protein [Nannocystaceae bacterium]
MASQGTIIGVVRSFKTNEVVANALVVLQCTCLQGNHETQTNAEGFYAFRNLPPGNYTIQILVGNANVSKIVTLPKDARFRANFKVDPNSEFKRLIRVKSQSISSVTSRDFTSVVEISPAASRDAAGISISGGSLKQIEFENREGYAHNPETDFLSLADAPLSTFSIDVDTASYSNARRYLTDGSLPPADAVRTEELVNYFTYDYAEPSPRHPISVTVEVGDCPWKQGHWLAHIGLKAKAPVRSEPLARNLVFLIDISGSMNGAAKLPLVQKSLHLLTDTLRPEDRISLVVYAGSSEVVLRPTSGQHKRTIRAAIDGLQSGGSTNGGGGIQLAYRAARSAFIDGGVNRVILATDGDFNVGATSAGALTRMIERKRKSGIYLSTLGFGSGNYQDDTMELLADKGNGNYAYIDSLAEAKKVLVHEAAATLVPVADDVKLQVEFNPRFIASYRLIGYENRRLADRDFADDTKDAGELGAGHTVTALYELVPATTKPAKREVGPLRYQTDRQRTSASTSDELARVKLRYKRPGARKSVLVDFVADTSHRRSPEKASDNFRWSAAVAGWSLLLRGSKHLGNLTHEKVLHLAQGAVGRDPYGYRREFMNLVRASSDLK